MAGETEITLPSVDVGLRSDPGRDPSKQVNEDACGWRETRFGVLGVVCDGMGGHVGGREASNAALASIFEAFEGAAPGTAPRDVLRDAIRLANARVRSLAMSEPTGGRPGSTVVTVLVHGGGTEVAHVGDSRAYLVHQGQVFQLTRDHSMVEEMVQAKILTPAQAAVHPEANKITRALGIDDDVEVEVRRQPVAHVAGDAFVLCSDGLTDLVEPAEVLQIVSSDPPLQAASKLVDLANARGGHDNVTVVVLKPRASAPSPTTGPVALTVTDSGPVTLRPAPVTPVAPRFPAPVPPVTATDERAQAVAQAQSAVGRRLAVTAVAVVILAALAIAFARAHRPAPHGIVPPLPSGRVATIDAGAPLLLGTAPTASVVLAPLVPPTTNEADASGVTPLTPAVPPTPDAKHPRAH